MTTKDNVKISSSLEDYLEVIYNLTEAQGMARSKDIADAMNVSRASVTGALKALSDKGLVNYQPYAYITLTEQGCGVAKRVVNRHQVLARFFKTVLGAEPDVSEAAACRTEHTLGPEITSRLMAFIEYVTQNQDNGNNITEEFQHYWQQYNEQ